MLRIALFIATNIAVMVLLTVIVGGLLGSILGVGLIATHVISRSDYIPFGPFLSLGAVVAMLFGAGIAMLALPGPGWAAIFLGLAILSTEYVWAQRMLNYAKRKGQEAKDRILRNRSDEGAPEGD